MRCSALTGSALVRLAKQLGEMATGEKGLDRYGCDDWPAIPATAAI